MEDAKFEKSTAELLAYRAQMARDRQMGVGGMNGMNGGQVNIPYQHSGYANSSYSVGAHSARTGGYAQSVSTFGSGKGYQRY